MGNTFGSYKLVVEDLPSRHLRWEAAEAVCAGVLVGMAVGDAVGSRVEGCPRDTCLKYVTQLRSSLDRGQRDFEEEDGPFQRTWRSAWPWGQYTEHTQLSRELVSSAAARGTLVDPADVAARFADVQKRGRLVGRDLGTARVLSKLAQGARWTDAANDAGSPSQSPASRGCVVGALALALPGAWLDALLDASLDQSIITHLDEGSIGGSHCMALAVALAAHAGQRTQAKTTLDPTAFLAQLAQLVEPHNASYARHLQALVEVVPVWSSKKACERIMRIGVDPKGAAVVDVKLGPLGYRAVLWAIYSFLASPEDFTAVLARAISAGGDTDATAALSCALCGAYGASRAHATDPESTARSCVDVAVPPALSCGLTDQGNQDFHALICLASNARRALNGAAPYAQLPGSRTR